MHCKYVFFLVNILFIYLSGLKEDLTYILVNTSDYAEIYHLGCNLEKISRKLKFDTYVPYTSLIHQKKIPTLSTLENATIHNGGFTDFFAHFKVKNLLNLYQNSVLGIYIWFISKFGCCHWKYLLNLHTENNNWSLQ